MFYPTANLAARRYVRPELANDPTIYPPEAVMKTLFARKPLPPEIQRLVHRMWTAFKLGR